MGVADDIFLHRQIDFFTLTYGRWKPQWWGERARAMVVPWCKTGDYVSWPA